MFLLDVAQDREQNLFLVFTGSRGDEGEGGRVICDRAEDVAGFLHLFTFQSTLARVEGRIKGDVYKRQECKRDGRPSVRL